MFTRCRKALALYGFAFCLALVEWIVSSRLRKRAAVARKRAQAAAGH
ncbi:MAG: hypothetical protein ABJD97_01955 [Betaproteobacteria bacterium]